MVKRYADGTHGYLRLEMLNLHLQEAKRKLKRFRLFGTTASLFRGAKTYLTSARAIRSTFQPRTWKIVYTGQVLRKRALKADEVTKAAQIARAGAKKPPQGGPPLPPGAKPLPPRPTGKTPAKK